MRNAFVYVIALGAFAFTAIPTLAENVDISGTHSANEIKTTCKKAGGTFSGVDKNLGSYGCHKGGNVVSCTKDGKCVGCTNCTGNSKQAAGGTTDTRTVGGILTNGPVKKVQPLTQQKTTRSPTTAPGQPLAQQKTTTSPGLRPMQTVAGSQSSRRSTR